MRSRYASTSIRLSQGITPAGCRGAGLLEEVAVAPLVLFTPDAEEDDDGDDADHEQPRHEQQRQGQLRDVVLVAQTLPLSNARERPAQAASCSPGSSAGGGGGV